jgi:aspartate aminotransferase-like enzyme
MEGAVRNGVRRRALSLVNGAFSERFRDLVRDCGREVETYEAAMGHAHTPDEVFQRLRAGGFDAVTVVHSETSTGVLDPLVEIADAVRRAETEAGEEILLLVDGVTSVGGMLVEAETWGLDFLLTGSQKAMALPPGLAFAAASERMMDRARTLTGRGQYFDLIEFDSYWRKHQTPNTPAVSLLYALAAQAERIATEGVEARAAALVHGGAHLGVGGGARAALGPLPLRASRPPFADGDDDRRGGQNAGDGDLRGDDGARLDAGHRLRQAEGFDVPHRAHGGPHGG